MTKKPILETNPIEAALNAAGMIPEPPTIPEIIPIPETNEVQFLKLFGEYVLPYRMTGAKNRRVQLLLYPDEWQRAKATADALNISLNELISAALTRLCNDYDKEKGSAK